MEKTVPETHKFLLPQLALAPSPFWFFPKSFKASHFHPSQVFGLISSFLGSTWPWVVLKRKSLQKYTDNAGVSQGFILGLMLFLLYICDS